MTGRNKLHLIAFFLVALTTTYSAWTFADENAATPEKKIEVKTPGTVYYINLKQVITPAAADFVVQSVKKANADNVECLVILLDTPGGLLESTREIVQSFFSSEVPIAVYVAPSGARAGSAGTFITVAGHIAAMAPGTNIGAAHPVGGSGEDIKGDMREKVENDAVAQIKAWAEQRGRNVEWVERAVRESVSITDKEALEKGVVEITARDINDLLAQIDGKQIEVAGGKKVVLNTKNAQQIELKMSLKQLIVSTISEPNVAYILLLIGLLGLFLEYVHPGTLVPGIIGGICVILFFVVQSMPINYIGVALIILAVGFFIAEIFVTSFGLLTIAGLGCFIIGALLLFDTPGNAPDDIGVSPSVLIPGVVVLALAFMGAGYLVLKTQLRKPITGKEGLIGELAEVRAALNPDGTVFFHGEFWTAHSNKPVIIGKKVKVLKVDHMKLEVEPVEGENGN